MIRNCIPGLVTLPESGINLSRPKTSLREGECLLTQNLYFRSDLMKRKGFVRHSPNAIASSPVLALHRFLAGSTKQLIGVAGTVARKLDEGTGAWTDILTGLANAPTRINTWGALKKAYLANGSQQKQYDGTTAIDVPFAPSNAIVLLPYRSRLLSIDSDGFIRWSIPDYEEPSGWTTLDTSLRLNGPGKSIGMFAHALSSPEKGTESKVLAVKPYNMALLSGYDFTISSTPDLQFTLRLDDLPRGIGSISPESFADCKIGTCLFGTDRQVYLLPYGGNTFITLGDKIRSAIIGVQGIESVGDLVMSKVAGVYDDGFYKLHIPTSGDNVYQFWLDISRLTKDKDGLYGPWYGPMIGQSFTTFLSQPDNSVLLAGDYNGFVNRLSDPIYGDNSLAIVCRFKDKHRAFNSIRRDSEILATELVLKDIQTIINMYLYDISGPIGSVISLQSNSQANYMNEGYMNEVYLNSDEYVRIYVNHVDLGLIGRAISTVLEHISASEDFRLSFIQHKVKGLVRIIEESING